jgi:predicted sugar kinase
MSSMTETVRCPKCGAHNEVFSDSNVEDGAATIMRLELPEGWAIRLRVHEGSKRKRNFVELTFYCEDCKHSPESASHCASECNMATSIASSIRRTRSLKGC